MAIPIFLKGLSETQNIQAGFQLQFSVPEDTRELSLKIAGRTFWKVWLDGEFLHAGPARTAHGHACIDTVPLPRNCCDAAVHYIAIEVSGQNSPGLQEETGESSFIYASVEADCHELTGTCTDTPALCLHHRRTLVEPYSHARPFNELYDLNDSYYTWRTSNLTAAECFPVEEYKVPVVFLPRSTPFPCMDVYNQGHLMSISDIEQQKPQDILLYHYETEEMLRKFPEHPAIEGMQDQKLPFTGKVTYPENAILAVESTHMFAADWEFDKAQAGFCGVVFTLDSPGIVDILHADRFEGRLLSRRPDGCNDVIRLHCPAGTYHFESFLPYFTKYMRITLRKGNSLTLHNCYIREYQHMKNPYCAFSCEDELLNRIYKASIDTFRANAADIFMDCPDRERGGWLCDSLWMGRAEKYLFGDTSINRSMIQNYAYRWKDYRDEPGFACCYPSGMEANMPTWSLFFILQLEEYLHMSGDTQLIEESREHVCVFLESLQIYENSEGLLENPPGWIFVDWSCSNDAEHQTPVSTAVNALYAAVLLAADRMYQIPSFKEKAERIQRFLRISRQPLGIKDTNGFFPDVLEWNAEKQLSAKSVYSEACQYYCYWTGTETPEHTPDLFDRVVEEYGICPRKLPSNTYVTPAEIFIGLFIRLDMLSKYGCYDYLKEEIRHLFGYMLDHGPGTFWESQAPSTSRCHGFTSHAGVWLVRDFLGLQSIDEQALEITIAPHPEGMRWANGSTITNHGPVFLEWRTDRTHVWLNLSAPKEYTVKWNLPEEWNKKSEWIINGISIKKEERKNYQ